MNHMACHAAVPDSSKQQQKSAFEKSLLNESKYKTEIMELIANHLLSTDSLVPLEHIQKRCSLPLQKGMYSSQLRDSIISGDWETALSCLSNLVDNLPATCDTQWLKDLFSRMIYEQHYLELMNADRIHEAVTVLRSQLARFHDSPLTTPHTVNSLCKVLVEMDKSKWHHDLEWNSEEHKSRLQLLNHIRFLIHAFLMPQSSVVPNRLCDLLDLGMQQRVSSATPSCRPQFPSSACPHTSYMADAVNRRPKFPNRLVQTHRQFHFITCSFSPNCKYLAALGQPWLSSGNETNVNGKEASCVLLLFTRTFDEPGVDDGVAGGDHKVPVAGAGASRWVPHAPITLRECTLPPASQNQPPMQMEWRCDEARLYVLHPRHVYSISLATHAVHQLPRPHRDVQNSDVIKVAHALAGTDCLVFVCDNVTPRVLNSRFHHVHLNGDSTFRARLMASHMTTGAASSTVRVYVVDFWRRIRVMQWKLNKTLVENTSQRLYQDHVLSAAEMDKKVRHDEEEMDVTEAVGSLTSTDSGEDIYEEQSESDEHHEDTRLALLRYTPLRSTGRGSAPVPSPAPVPVTVLPPTPRVLPSSATTPGGFTNRLYLPGRLQPPQRSFAIESPVIIGSYSTLTPPPLSGAVSQSGGDAGSTASSSRSDTDRAYIRRLLQAAWHVENLLTNNRGGTLWAYETRSPRSSSGESSSTAAGNNVPSWFLEPTVLSLGGTARPGLGDTVSSAAHNAIQLAFTVPGGLDSLNASFSDTVSSSMSAAPSSTGAVQGRATATSSSSTSAANAEPSSASNSGFANEQQLSTSSSSGEPRHVHGQPEEEAIVIQSCEEDPTVPFGFITTPEDILDMQCNRNGQRLITLHPRSIRVWNAWNGNLLRDLLPTSGLKFPWLTPFHRQKLNLSISNGTEYVSAVTQDMRILFWSLEETYPVHEIDLSQDHEEEEDGEEEEDDDVEDEDENPVSTPCSTPSSSSLSSSPSGPLLQPRYPSFSLRDVETSSSNGNVATNPQVAWSDSESTMMAMVTPECSLQIWTAHCKHSPSPSSAATCKRKEEEQQQQQQKVEKGGSSISGKKRTFTDSFQSPQTYHHLMFTDDGKRSRHHNVD